ncbi:acyl-CoA dehydrogenase [Mycobacterium sp. E342]|uniref:acyl-CoA dehydrogenase family protein n=1 Tax=unclassified Mycobacterium TaxID=2642494 RepID=UPI0008018124|nr:MULTISPECIES: acyl-CoA dehydrogenase family protein [unclassified Mycobacterium]OBH13947.1 acyl-CoA dehydrogenase [Mycobacterium sp. E3247]OBH35319.1 acyl-CoA dehydrogenase [Mycobacterium sp. E342]
MTTATDDADLLAVRKLADDILASSTEPLLDVQRVDLEYSPELWSTLTGAGLTLLTTPEARGGAGASLRELAVVLEACGYHAAPVPLAEHDLLASWLVGIADLPADFGVMTAAVTDQQLRERRLTAVLDDVPWAGAAEALVVAGDGFIAKVPLAAARIDPVLDIAGQPGGRVHIDIQLEPEWCIEVAGSPAQEFRLRGALARSVQTCGALSRALALTCEHAQQREQFGRPIAKFQAVQALIASAASSIALAKAASEFAVEAVTAHGFDTPPGVFAVSVAKIEAARAATLVARNAHQVHGAIGFTLDHRLRHFTSRALAWRAEFGVQRQWQHRLGELVLESPDGVWEVVTALSSGVF